MFERFTADAASAVTLGLRQAEEWADGVATPGHLLLGVLLEGTSPVAKALQEVGLEPESLRWALGEALGTPGEEPLPQRPALSDEAATVVKEAGQQADAFLDRQVGSGLLVAALVDADDVGPLLETCGVSAESVRRAAYRAIHEERSPEQRSLESVRRDLVGRPGSAEYRLLLRTALAAYDGRGRLPDYEVREVLRGAFLRIAADRLEPTEAWSDFADGVLEQELFILNIDVDWEQMDDGE